MRRNVEGKYISHILVFNQEGTSTQWRCFYILGM